MTDLREQLQQSLGTAYTLDRELAGGGMSRVFVATDTALGRSVVVKVLTPDMAAGVSIERFKREIAVAARLQHPHIVPLHSAGEMDGVPYFTMPFVEGESLRVQLARRGEMPIAEGVRILRELASALDYAHQEGVVHRDIKPDNVLLSHGSAMVTDFGVAKAISSSSNAEHDHVTSLGIALGTPAYMSPEQAAASPAIDARADIYAFGVLAYELFAGRPPFTGRSPQALLAAQVSEMPEPIQKLRPSLPMALAALIMRCLEKHPADRPQAASEIVHTLDAITTPSGGSMPTVGLAPRSVGRPNSRRIARWAVGPACLLLAIGIAMFAHGRTQSEIGRPVMLAVLPFENLGPAEDEYFADGVADAITNRLAGVRSLGVIAQRSAGQYKHSTKALREIGHELGVQYVLQGTVRWQTDAAGTRRVRVSPSLVRVSDGTVRWAAEPYVAEPRDLFAVQDDIGGRVASALDVALADRAADSEPVTPTRNPNAYDAYLRGIEYLHQFYVSGNFQLNDLAAEQFQRAVHLDTTFALAEAKYAETQLFSIGFSPADSIKLRHTKDAVQRALTLAPNLADAHFEKGLEFEVIENDLRATIQEMQRAVDLRPGDAALLLGLGDAKASLGDSTGLLLIAKSIALDPLNGIDIAVATADFQDFRHYAEALRYARQWAALAPENADALATQALIVLSARGDTAEAARLLTESERRTPRPTSGVLRAWSALDVGTSRISRVTLQEMVAQTAADTATYYAIKAGVYARLGRSDLQVKYVDSLRAVVRRPPGGAILGLYFHMFRAIAAALAGDRSELEREAGIIWQQRTVIGPRNNELASSYCVLAQSFAFVVDTLNAVRFERLCLELPSGQSSWDVRLQPQWAKLRDAPAMQAVLRGFPPPT